jgi:hypothetical protein
MGETQEVIHLCLRPPGNAGNQNPPPPRQVLPPPHQEAPPPLIDRNVVQAQYRALL